MFFKPEEDIQRKEKIVLVDSSIFKGLSFRETGEFSGGVVFNISLSAYQKIITEPFFKIKFS